MEKNQNISSCQTNIWVYIFLEHSYRMWKTAERLRTILNDTSSTNNYGEQIE